MANKLRDEIRAIVIPLIDYHASARIVRDYKDSELEGLALNYTIGLPTPYKKALPTPLSNIAYDMGKKYGYEPRFISSSEVAAISTIGEAINLTYAAAKGESYKK